MMWMLGRKFIAFLLSLGVFFAIMIIAIFKQVTQDLGMFAVLLATAVMQISGAYYAGNVLAKKKGSEEIGIKE